MQRKTSPSQTSKEGYKYTDARGKEQSGEGCLKEVNNIQQYVLSLCSKV